MRIAVVSDIHGNLPALEAVLEALSPYDALWQLGDIVGYGPQPEEVVLRLRDEGASGVCGNHDAAALGRIDSDWFNDDAREAVTWSAGRLSEDTRGWLEGLPEKLTSDGYTMVHGSPRDPMWEYVYTSSIARASFRAFDTDHCLVGHTHVPLVFREDDGGIETLSPADGSKLELDARRTIINPGSVGQPRDGDPRAAWLLLDTEAQSASWRRADYDIAAAMAAIRAARLPESLAERLQYGQ